MTRDSRVATRGIIGCCLLIFSISSAAVTDIDFTLDQGGSIAGQVTEDGAPPGLGLSNFIVYALDATTGDFAASATTDFLGNYTLTGLPAGNYIIYVNSGTGFSILSGGQVKKFAGEYYPNTYDRSMAGQVAVSAGGSATMVNVALGGGGSVSGTVIQASDSMPMSFVPVFLSPYVASDTDFLSQVLFFSGFTDGTGAYTVEGVPPGDYIARTVQSSSLANEFYGNTYQRNLASMVTVTDGMETANIDFALDAGRSISGTVTRQSNGQAMGGVAVFSQAVNPEMSLLIPGVDLTDGSGNYQLQGLPPGSYYVGVNFAYTDMQEYASEFYPGAYRLADAVAQNLAAMSKTGIDFTVEMGGTISGVVRRGDTMQPMQGITVAVAPATAQIDYQLVGAFSHYTQTDANGQYAINGLPPGPLYVGATPAGGFGGASPMALYPGYFAPQLYDGAYTLGSAGMVNAVLNTEVPNIDFDLEIGGVISGQVTRADNDQPIAGVSVVAGINIDANVVGGELLYYLLFDREGGTDTNGNYQIVGVPPGNAAVYAVDNNGMFMPEVYDNKTDFDMPTLVAVTLNGITTSTMSGTLAADRGGDPAEGLLVEVFEASTMQLAGSATSAANGGYSVPGLFPGSYQVRVDGGEMYTTEFYDNAELLADAATVLVTLGANVTGVDFGLALVNGGNLDLLITTLMLLLDE